MYKEADKIPYYQQLKNMFIEDIENGKLKHGDKVPSERELAIQFNISRMTARHALSILEREGFVERRVGLGTFISHKKIKWNFITVNSLTKSMEEKGLKLSTEIIFSKKTAASETLAESLDVPVGEELFSLKRLRIVDSVPIAIELSQIPLKFCLGIENHIKENGSLYRVLAEEYGIELVHHKQRMRISLSDPTESKLLKISEESPCLLIKGTTHDKNKTAIEYAQTLARGDLVEFYSESITSKQY